jgi:hypothetical protein
MVRKMKIESIYKDEEIEEAPALEELEVSESESEHENPEVTPEKENKEEIIYNTKSKNKYLDMPTTEKTLEQVQCNLCSKFMSAKNLRYSHPKYCLQRDMLEKPEEIPIPKMNIKNMENIKNKIILPVKSKNVKKIKTKKVIIKEDSSSEEEEQIIQKPEITKPALIRTISHHETFHNQMKERNEVRNLKYKNLLENAF